MLTNMDLVLAKEKLDKSKLFFGGEETDVHLQLEIDAVLLSDSTDPNVLFVFR